MRFSAALLCLLLVASVWAGDKPQPIPPLTGPVIDLTHTLSTSQQQQLSQKLLSLHQKHGAQMQVLMIPSSAPEDAFSYSMRVVDAWKLGSAEKDDGLLLFIAKNDRRSQIQVGYGLEGVIPDVVASRLQSDVMAPYFKQGDFYGGINAMIDSVYARITGDVSMVKPDSKKESNKDNDDLMGLYVFLAIVVCVVFVWVFQPLLGKMVTALIGVPVYFGFLWGFVGLPWLDAVITVGFVYLVASATRNKAIMEQLLRELDSPAGGGGWGGSGGFGGGGRSGGGGYRGGGGSFGGGGAGGRW